MALTFLCVRSAFFLFYRKGLLCCARDEGSHVARMGFTIGALIEAVLLFVNALAILNEERFLRPCALR